MKLSSKPISSPGRTEKFPPQLMRFLRTNVGSGSRSRSRGRSRSSTMFFRRKNAAAIETQEPSSPKVTCMGQVRVRRSSKQAASAGTGRSRVAGTRRRCKWLRNVLFCHPLARKIKPPLCQTTWRKWVLFFQVGFLRKTEIRGDSSGFERKIGNDSEFSEREDEDKEGDEKVVAKVFVSNCSSPPKNALLLTRCRSAPYRSSSLASKFWGSPQTTEETEVTEQRAEQENTEEQSETDNPTSEGESTSEEESRIGPETVEKLKFFKEFEGAMTDRFIKSINIEDVKAGEEADSIRPVILTRCKSEPMRTAEKTDTEMNFRRKRRLGFADSR
ncbi:hypothetical protein F2P56_008548 [Juglans regia]|uniref:Uncharacterized protein n=1 Tax=Juglans regia TaxID=51240 RepID=A0A833XUR9_JUGRE|nr:hypothetical protein F2P56_008548 [Juglans regia]